MDDTRTEEIHTEDEYGLSDLADNIRVHRDGKLCLTCYVCKGTWISRSDKLPDRCSKCRSTRWNNSDIIHNECRRCGHRWISESALPAKCPKCQSYRWNEPLQRYELTCKRCSHEWKAKRQDPIRCPKCKSTKWNEYRREYHCPKSDRSYIIRSNSRPDACPSCDSNSVFSRCSVCGHLRKKAKGDTRCPSCRFDECCGIGNNAKEADMERSRIKMLDILQNTDSNDADILANILGIEAYKAEIYMTYMKGNDPVKISMDLELSFEHVMNVIGSVDTVIKRY